MSSPNKDRGDNEKAKNMKETKLNDYFTSTIENIKKARSSDECFNEIINLDENKVVLIKPNSMDKNTAVKLQSTLDKNKENIAKITEKHSEAEVATMYANLQQASDELISVNTSMRTNQSKWNHINESIKLANNAHKYHMDNGNFIMASSFQKIITAGKNVTLRAYNEYIEKEKAANDFNSSEDASSSKDNNENTNSSSNAATNNNNEPYTVINVDGDEEDVDKMFEAGSPHKGGKKRKTKSSGKSNNVHKPSKKTKSETEQQYKKKSTFLNALSRFKLQDEAYIWTHDNEIMCVCCNCIITAARKMKQHSDGKKHKKLLKSWKKNKVCC